MSGVRHLSVSSDEAGIRLDRWFKARFPAVPHGQLAKWLRKGQVRIDGRRAKPGDRVEAGQTIRVPPVGERAHPTEPGHRAPMAVSDDDAAMLRRAILFQDGDVIVLDKPAGLAVQGGSGTTRHLDGLLSALAGQDGAAPRLVHRLDRDTSGVLVLARTGFAARHLTASFRDGRVRKLYWAVVSGAPEADEGTIDLPLEKRRVSGEEKTIVSAVGQPAVTLFRVLDRYADIASWVAFAPLTGRTHQIRAHAASGGHPVWGDGKYGFIAVEAAGEAGRAGGLMLHARRISCPHPRGGVIDVKAPPPAHLRRIMDDFTFSRDQLADEFLDPVKPVGASRDRRTPDRRNTSRRR